MNLFVEENNVAIGFAPVNLSAAANSGDWFDMSGYESCAVVFVKAVGAASQDPTVTILQAKTNAGGTSKALTFTRVDVKQASALTTVGQFTTVTQAAANTYTSDTSGEDQCIWVIDIKSSSLDTENGYMFIQASVADPGTATHLGVMLYVGYRPRYVSKKLESALT